MSTTSISYRLVRRYVSKKSGRVVEATTGIRGTADEAQMTFQGYVRFAKGHERTLSVELYDNAGPVPSVISSWHKEEARAAA